MDVSVLLSSLALHCFRLNFGIECSMGTPELGVVENFIKRLCPSSLDVFHRLLPEMI
jgi:hypothetical protein